MSLSGRLEQAVIDTENYTEIFNQFVNGDDQTEVITSGGPVSSIAKAIKDLEDYYVNNNIVTSAESARDEAKVQAILSSGFADEASSDAAESLMYRNQASGFSVSAFNAQSSAESARDLSQTYRNQASGFSVSALEFSIEASGYAEQANIDYSTTVKNDGTILQSGKIPVIQGSGVLGESEFGFGATKAEVLESKSSSKIPTLDILPMMANQNLGITLFSGFTDIISGNGSTPTPSTYLPFSKRYNSASGGVGVAGCHSISSLLGFHHNDNFTFFNSSKRLIVSFKGSFRGGLGTGSEVRYAATSNHTTFAPLSSLGIGFLIKDGRSVYGIYHNGSGSEVQVDLATSLTSSNNIIHKLTVENVGNGVLNWYIGGELKGSASGFQPPVGSVGLQMYIDSKDSGALDDIQFFPPIYWGGY